MQNKTAFWLGILASAVVTIVILSAAAVFAFINKDKILTYAVKQIVKAGEVVGGNNNESLAPLLSQEVQVINAVAQSSPAVVSLIVSKDVPILEEYYRNLNPFGDLFSPFNFKVPELRQQGTEHREIGGGTGFLINADGLAITNQHVVADTKAEYTALTSTGEKYKVEVIARDPVLDIAFIKIKGAKNLPFLEFETAPVQVGQTVIAIGNALSEFQNTVSVGVISGLARSIVASDSRGGSSERLDEVIQTDAAINPGNSGGPLLNLRGKVVGVNVAVASGSENIGFAIPASLVKGAADSVAATGKIVRPYLGIRYIPITTELKEANKLSVDYGVLVARGETREELAVIPGSPADKAGIVENDIILEINGTKLEGDPSSTSGQGTSLASLIRHYQVGDTVKLRVLSKGKEKVVSVKLAEMKN